MNSKFTEQQSLELISEMIERARNNVQKGSANSIILWGYAISFIAILNIILIHTLNNPAQSFWVWLLVFPVFVIDYFNDRKIDRTVTVKTHIDAIVSFSWKAFGISCAIFVLSIFLLAYSWKDYQMFLLINPVIMLMIGSAEFVTAKACRFKPFFYGAFALWLGAIACIGTCCYLKRVDIQFALLAIGMILSFVIPGHQLNRKASSYV